METGNETFSSKSNTLMLCTSLNIPQKTRAIFKPPNRQYSGTPLMWTLWGPDEVSCIEGCPHFRGTFTLGKHVWDTAKCP